jgi:hypothetical protein
LNTFPSKLTHQALREAALRCGCGLHANAQAGHLRSLVGLRNGADWIPMSPASWACHALLEHQGLVEEVEDALPARAKAAFADTGC